MPKNPHLTPQFPPIWDQINRVRWYPTFWVCLVYALIHPSIYTFFLLVIFIVTHNLAITSIFVKHNEKQALEALLAIQKLGKTHTLIREPINKALENEVEINLDFLQGKVMLIKVIPVDPTQRPFSQLKAFPQPFGFYSPIFLNIGSKGELTAAQRFFLLHEISHTISWGGYASMDAHMWMLRLISLYFPLFFIFNLPTVFVFFAWHCWIDSDSSRVELEADYQAWRMYLLWKGKEKTTHAARLILKVFHLQAKQEENPRRLSEILKRVDLANRISSNERFRQAVIDLPASHSPFSLGRSKLTRILDTVLLGVSVMFLIPAPHPNYFWLFLIAYWLIVSWIWITSRMNQFVEQLSAKFATKPPN